MKKVLYIEIHDEIIVTNGFTYKSSSKAYTSPIGGHKVTAMGYINNDVYKELKGLIKTKASLMIEPIDVCYSSTAIDGLAKSILLIIKEHLTDEINEMTIHSNSTEIGLIARYALTSVGDSTPLQSFNRNPFEDITSISNITKFIVDNSERINYSTSSRYGFDRTHVTEFFSVAISKKDVSTVTTNFKTFWKKPKPLDPRLYGKYLMVFPKTAVVTKTTYKVIPLIYEEFEEVGVEEPSNMVSEYIGELPTTIKRIVDAYLYTTRTETPFVILLKNISGLSRKLIDDFGVVIPKFDLRNEMTLSSHHEELATVIKPIGLSLLVLDFVDEINSIKKNGTGKDITEHFVKNKKCIIGMKDKSIKMDNMTIFLGEDSPDRGYIKSVERHLKSVVLYERVEGAISRYVTVTTLSNGTTISSYSPSSSMKPSITYNKIPEHKRLERINRNKKEINMDDPFELF